MKSLIQDTFHRLINELNFTTHRYLYCQFHIDDRLTGLIGPRGVGKTTLLLQFIKDYLYQNQQVIYFSADHIYFNTYTLLEFVTELYQTDEIKVFFIYEVHKYSNWNQELKNIYDSFPSIKVIFSGSSSVDLIKGSYDLSRRATLFHLHGMSFREYLNFNTQSDYSTISLAEILKNHKKFTTLSQIPKLLGHFKKYLEIGYYPFHLEKNTLYYEKIKRVIDKTIYEDIANFYQLKTQNLHYFQKLLNYLASIPPGETNINNITKNLGIDHKTTQYYLTILADTGLIRLIKTYHGGAQQLKKPQKIFLNNTTEFYTINSLLGENIEKGTVRELMFIQSLENAGHNIYYSMIGDYQTNDTIFEIGGKNKTRKQLKAAKLPAFLVKDDILLGQTDVIPLYLLGFLY